MFVEKSKKIRRNIVKMLYLAGSGHPAGSLGIVDILTVLYFKILKHNSKKPTWSERDRLILSNGHVCPALYSCLAESGYFPVKELWTLRKLNSKLQGHPSRLDTKGVEFSTASLGQGLGCAVGMALAGKRDNKKHFIYCLTSDGEHDEGSTWEAIAAANKYQLNNLINIIDCNNIQISGYTHDVWPLQSLKNKYESFGWQVYEINGHNHKTIMNTLLKAKKSKKPVCVIAYTIPGKGVSFMENDYNWHGKAPNKEEYDQAMEELK
jgi:transketolase